MKKFILYRLILAVTTLFLFASCEKEPVDENGLLVSQRAECFVTFFDLLGSDHRTVLVSGSTVIDTVNQTVTAVAKFGTNITYVKPYCSAAIDAVVEPKMGVWTDFTAPVQYTVVSGNRKVRKTYTITVTLQQ